MSKSSRSAVAPATVNAKAKAKTKAKSKAKTALKSKAKSKVTSKVKTSTKISKSAAKPIVAKAPAAKVRPAKEPALLRLVRQALEDMKAVDIRVLDVRGASDVTDYMVIAGGTSDRHLRSVADRVIQMCKAAGQRPLGVEGEQQGEWVLVDLPDVMVHIMLPRTRELYQLEQLWDADSTAGRG